MGCSVPFSNLESCASYKRKKGTEIGGRGERIESRHGRTLEPKKKQLESRIFLEIFKGIQGV